MPKKKTVVLFRDGYQPRIYKNVSESEIDAFRELGEVLVDPKIPKGVPPHKWEVDGKRIQIGASKEQLPQATEIIKEVEIEVGPDFDDLEYIEDRVEWMSNELLDKINKMYIIGGLVAFLLFLASFRDEIQTLIKGL